MSRAQPDNERLRSALRELAQSDIDEVVAAARERARTRAGKLIEDALVEELVRAAGRLNATPAPTGTTDHSTDRATAPSPSSNQRLWWAYCVLAAGDVPKVPAELEGIEPGTTAEVVQAGELAALVSAVPAGDYDDLHLREHLEDLAWLERTARRHEAVLEEALHHVSLVPLRLCTLYQDLDGVRRLLAEHAEALAASLERVGESAEWGVKVFAEQTASEVPRAEIGEDDEIAGRPGATYMIQRQRERERAEQTSELRGSCVEDVHHRVSACAREAKANPPQRPELHGRDMPMLLNGVYLVASERAPELHETVRALQSEWETHGFVIELTGPWPAYNFASEAGEVMP